MRVEHFQEYHFAQITQSNPKNHTGLGLVGEGEVRLLSVFKALTHSKWSYSILLLKGLLKAPKEWLLINYCNRVLIQPLERIVYTSRLWVIFEHSQNFRQIIGTPRRSIVHAAKSSRMQHTAKIKKLNNFENQI